MSTRHGGANIMASGPLGKTLDRLYQWAGQGSLDGLTDRELLGRFADHGDEPAFAELVRRHGPMALGVCRRLLGAEADAEDAFQAVFLVLVLRARSIRKRESVGSWLYGVASRVARRARDSARRRAAGLRRVSPRPEATAGAPAEDELRPVLDEELGRLPEKYRAPLVLCYLQGKTNEQAARELGWPAGSMSRRLSRARALLRRRLVRRGVTLAALGPASVAVPEALGQGAVRAGVATTRGAAAGGAVPAAAAALAKGAMRTMFMSRVKAVLLAALTVLLLGAGSTLLIHRALAAGAGPALQPAPAQPQAGVEKGPAGKGKAAEKKPEQKPPAITAKTVRALKFSPDAKLIIAGSGEMIRVYQMPNLKLRVEFNGGGKGAVALAVSPDGKLLASAGGQGDKLARLWDLGTGKVVRLIPGHEGEVTAVAFSPDGRALATASRDKSVRLWEVGTGKEINRLDGHKGEVTSVAFSRDGRTLASGGGDGALFLWDAQQGRILAKMQGHKGAVEALLYTPDNQSLVSGGLDGEVGVWDVPTGKRAGKFSTGKAGVTGLAGSPDGRLMAVTTRDGKVRIWEVSNGNAQEVPGKHPGARAVAFSPDARLLAHGSGETFEVWEVGRE
jgi:RNA polymerase sigma factor (sigma-70 family)